MGQEFHVGDRVRLIQDYPDGNGHLIIGATGTIMHIDSRSSIGVCWDEDIGGHDLNGFCERPYGWWVTGENIEVVYEDGPDVPDDDIASVDDIILLISA